MGGILRLKTEDFEHGYKKSPLWLSGLEIVNSSVS